MLGVEHLSTYLKIYKVGDIVDVKVLKVLNNINPILNNALKALQKETIHL